MDPRGGGKTWWQSREEAIFAASRQAGAGVAVLRLKLCFAGMGQRAAAGLPCLGASSRLEPLGCHLQGDFFTVEDLAMDYPTLNTL